MALVCILSFSFLVIIDLTEDGFFSLPILTFDSLIITFRLKSDWVETRSYSPSGQKR